MPRASTIENFTVSRGGYALIALGCASLLAFGYYLQFGNGLEPCPLCILQRVAFFAIASIAALATVHGPRGPARRVYAALIGLSALAGSMVAGRQTWLQHLPADQVPECGPGLEFMIEMYAPFEVLKRVLQGTGDCAKVDWTFLSFSIAEWALFCFSLILFTAFIQWRAARRREWL
jgi:disulfide bond formation protein DsbB